MLCLISLELKPLVVLTASMVTLSVAVMCSSDTDKANTSTFVILPDARVHNLNLVRNSIADTS